MNWVGAIIALGVLIVVHEDGHYFVARWCNMRVDRFSVGFGPAIWSFTRGETQFQIAPIPFGGFVQINGMLLADDADPDDPRSYPNRPAWQRFVTIFAGPATNYLFAVVLALGLYSIAGLPTGTVWHSVSDVHEGGDAYGKLKPGDRIVAVGGEALYWNHATIKKNDLKNLVDIVQLYGGSPVPLTVLRDGETINLTGTPKPDERLRKVLEGGKKPFDGIPWGLGLGLQAEEELISVGIFSAVGAALVYPVAQTERIATMLANAVVSGEARFTGPVGITSMVKSTIDAGWIAVIQLLMVLNVYLGLFNLFPLPALDGGRLVFLTYEMMTRRRANPKIESTVHMVGIMALFLVLFLVTYRDIAELLS